MEFVITNTDKEQDPYLNDDGTAKDAMGGTELMRKALFERLPVDLADQVNIISSRVRKVDESKPNLLWLHDTWDDPEVQHLREPKSRSRFDKLVFVSYHQFETYHLAHGVSYDESVVIRNAITPITPVQKYDDGVVHLVYHTTPHRGLELLVPVFEYLWENGYKDKIHLHVYSSFAIYGWESRDEPYKEIFDRCREHPGITYYGSVSNEEVRTQLSLCHIFAYPNIWPETSCIAAMEAMSAGCAIVCPTHGALPETTAGFANMYPYTEDHVKHANIFGAVLRNTIDSIRSENLQAKLRFQKDYTDNIFNWGGRKHEWIGLVQSVIQEKKKLTIGRL